MLKGGVFGFGDVGQHMTSRINRRNEFGDDVRIVAVANRGKPKRDIAEQQFGLTAYEKIDELLDHGLDFLLNVSTSHVHHETAIKCAQAGVPYLIEKPIALTVEDAQDIVEQTEKAGLINGVNYSMRYKPVFIKMKQMADEGLLGDVLGIWARTCRGHGWYANGRHHRAIAEPHESGGWIVHHMCHIIDWAIWIAGEVDEVYALTQSTCPPELDSPEAIFSTIKFKNGAIGTLTDQVGALRDHSAGILGTKASVSEMANCLKPLVKYCKESDPQWTAPHVIDPMETASNEDGLAHFIRCLIEGVETKVPVREAWYSLRVAHAMKRSAKEGRPIKID